MILVAFSVLLFAAVSIGAYAIWLQLVAQSDPIAMRLRQLRTAHPRSSTDLDLSRPPLLLALVARLGGFLPARQGRNALRSGLVAAGYRRPEVVLVFLGSKVLLAATLPLLWVAIAYATARPLGDAVAWTGVLAGVGFYLPSILLSFRQRSRRDEIIVALPDALDLMVVCVEAGLGMSAALQRVAGEIRLASPALSDELGTVHQEMQAGIARADALRNLAQRTGVDEVFALVAMLIQTDRLGTSVAQALRAHAESMRVRRRQRAEQMARKASIKLAFPLVFLILPALLTIILGPAAIQLLKALITE